MIKRTYILDMEMKEAKRQKNERKRLIRKNDHILWKPYGVEKYICYWNISDFFSMFR